MNFSYLMDSSLPNGVNIDKLRGEIILALDREDFYLAIRGPKLVVKFSATLDNAEQTILNNTINGHSPIMTDVVIDNIINLECQFHDTSITTYQTCAQYLYPGKLAHYSIKSVKILAYLESGTSYDVRLVDVTNGTLLGVASYSNIQTEIVTLDSLSTSPKSESLLEVQIKVNGTGAKVNVRSITVLESEV